MIFTATQTRVKDRGIPPTSFLEELVSWATAAPDEHFALTKDQPNTSDVYNEVKGELGPWEGLLHRKAAMLEVMRVHAGFESSWNWNEGVDTTNKTSMANIEGQETGAWQVSFDSTHIHDGAMKPFAVAHDIDTPAKFIGRMKADHVLAMEYYARLVRINTKWAGPILRHEINPYLSRAAVSEFVQLLK